VSRKSAAPVSAVRALVEPYFLKERSIASGVVLAVSGGPDSMALMRVAAEVRGVGALVPVTVGTVDHGLRPESRAEAETVGGWAGACGFAHRILAWAGEKPRTGLQEAARHARYNLLCGLTRETGASHILTAHTLDDQAETLLMRLSRGTGVGGLAGMRAETKLSGLTLARPFLAWSKAELLAMCAAHGWPYLQDPSNADPRFARSRWRKLTPLLAREGLTSERLAALALRAQRVEDALEVRTRAVLESATLAQSDASLELDGAAFLAEPEAIQLGVVARAVAAVAGAGAAPVRLERLEEHVLGSLRPALAEGRRLKLTLGGALIEAAPGRLRFSPEPPRRRKRGP
jgi:tRNA(Ile)-lysidine synthase